MADFIITISDSAAKFLGIFTAFSGFVILFIYFQKREGNRFKKHVNDDRAFEIAKARTAGFRLFKYLSFTAAILLGTYLVFRIMG